MVAEFGYLHAASANRDRLSDIARIYVAQAQILGSDCCTSVILELLEGFHGRHHGAGCLGEATKCLETVTCFGEDAGLIHWSNHGHWAFPPLIEKSGKCGKI